MFLLQLEGSPIEIFGNENKRPCSLVNLNFFPHIASVCGVTFIVIFLLPFLIFYKIFIVYTVFMLFTCDEFPVMFQRQNIKEVGLIKTIFVFNY